MKKSFYQEALLELANTAWERANRAEKGMRMVSPGYATWDEHEPEKAAAYRRAAKRLRELADEVSE